MRMIEKSFLVVVGLIAIVGCHGSDVAREAEPATESDVSLDYLTMTEPGGAMPVGEARNSVQDEQTITLVGTIGGSSEPFVDGMAAFTIVDPKVPFCAPEEGCPTPWDYCCKQDQVKDNIATVKIVDQSGSAVSSDARKLLGVKELSTVVVEGQAQRDESGNLTIAATRVFVRPSE